MIAASEFEVSGSTFGVTGVMEVSIGEVGSGATGERATTLMVLEKERGTQFLMFADRTH